MAHIPIWGITAAVNEMKWARSVGLKAINLPAPQAWLPQYNKPVWDPLWSAAEELEMPLITHFGAGGVDVDYTGVDGLSFSTLRPPSFMAVVFFRGSSTLACSLVILASGWASPKYPGTGGPNCSRT